ncbi:pentatricopeptide repeat-containing protein At4g01400, mitochondrial-like [Zingiber officinale]|nr:pentatricopeptide repeat-containing protein At4g01400, mitochondrial-like [Zingiber officinale]
MVRPFMSSFNFLRRAFSAAPTASFGHPPMPSIGSPARIHRLIAAQADPLLAKEIFDVASSLRPDLPLRPSSLHSLILKLARGGHFSASSSLLRRLPSPSPALLSSLFLTFSRLGRPDLALYTFRRLVSSPSPSTPPRPKLFRRLLSALAAHPSSLPSALSLLKSSPSFGVPHSVRAHNVLIHAFARTGNVAVAYSLFNRLFALDLAPDTSTYRILMQALCRKSQVSTACNLLDDMLNKGYTPDALTYTTLLNSLCRKKRLREAYKLLCRMKVRGCNPDIVHYNTLIVGLCRQGRPLDACKVLEDMPDKGCFPNLVSYSTLIHGLCAQGQYDQGLAYLELMLSKELVPHFSVAHALVKGLCSVGKVEEACRVMEATLRHGVAPHVDTWDLVVAGVCDDDMEQLMDYIRKVANEEEWRKNTRIVQVGRGLNEYMVNKSSKSTRHGSQTK